MWAEHDIGPHVGNDAAEGSGATRRERMTGSRVGRRLRYRRRGPRGGDLHEFDIFAARKRGGKSPGIAAYARPVDHPAV